MTIRLPAVWAASRLEANSSGFEASWHVQGTFSQQRFARQVRPLTTTAYTRATRRCPDRFAVYPVEVSGLRPMGPGRTRLSPIRMDLLRSADQYVELNTERDR